VGSYRSSQGLVIVEHSRQYNLYLSDETGVYYSLSLDNIVIDNIRSAIDIVLVSWCAPVTGMFVQLLGHIMYSICE